MAQTVQYNDDDHIRIITIRNPTKRNAFSGMMALELRDILDGADDDPNIRCVVVTGDGTEAFSSGHDLQEVLENPETAGDPEVNVGFSLPGTINTPVIAAVNGYAYAAGFILAMNADIRIAGDNAEFCIVGTRLGMVPIGGQLSRILHLIPYSVAFKMIATGRPLNASQAKEAGFVTNVCDRSETLDQALTIARQITQVSPAALQASKRCLNTTLSRGLDAGLSAETQYANMIRNLPDTTEGINAFMEKREPVYNDIPSEFRAHLKG